MTANRYTDEELLEDLRQVADRVGRAPTAEEYDELGASCAGTQHLRFGSWNDALQEVGLEPNDRNSIPTEELAGDLRRVAEDLGRPPGVEEYNRLGKFDYGVVGSVLGGGRWGDALLEVGLDPGWSYAGTSMRSSYETATAAALDEAGLGWEYEPGWIETTEGRYLPDFVLDDGTVVEAKGRVDYGDGAVQGPKLRELMDRGRRVVVVGSDEARRELPHDVFVPHPGGLDGLPDAL